MYMNLYTIGNCAIIKDYHHRFVDEKPHLCREHLIVFNIIKCLKYEEKFFMEFEKIYGIAGKKKVYFRTLKNL